VGLGNKDLDFKGKAITVKSDNGPENCVIDCEGNGRDLWIMQHRSRSEEPTVYHSSVRLNKSHPIPMGENDQESGSFGTIGIEIYFLNKC
jgi:hypothetical protein